MIGEENGGTLAVNIREKGNVGVIVTQEIVSMVEAEAVQKAFISLFMQLILSSTRFALFAEQLLC